MDDARITCRWEESAPDRQIGLQDAIEQVVLRKWGAEFVAPFTSAQLRGPKAREIEIELRSRAEKWQDARDEILGWFRTGKLTHYWVSKRDPTDARATDRVFWNRSEHEYETLQRSILDRNEDLLGQWKQVLDWTELHPLLVGIEGREPSCGDNDTQGVRLPDRVPMTNGPLHIDERVGRKRGPQSVLREAAEKQMLARIESGELTRDGLADMKQTVLMAEFNTTQTTAREARKKVLKKLRQTPPK